jgi:hypothetical protein
MGGGGGGAVISFLCLQAKLSLHSWDTYPLSPLIWKQGLLQGLPPSYLCAY